MLLTAFLLGITLCAGRNHAYAASLKLLSPAAGSEVNIINRTVQRYLNRYAAGDWVGRSVKTDLYGSSPLTLRWKAPKGASGKYYITLAENRTLKKGKIQLTSSKTRCSITNLKAGTTYYWRVRVRSAKKKGWISSQIRSFTTASTVRLLTVGGVSNMRDLGGRVTEDGRQVKQGMVYRSAHLDRITKSGKTMMKNRLQIKTELDLRKTGQGRAGNGSALGYNTRYIQISGVQYAQMWKSDAGRQAIVDEMRVFASEQNYPILFHCIYGRDRTGTLAFMLEALLGVSEADIFRDYALTYLTAYGNKGLKSDAREYLDNFSSLYDYINTYPAQTENASLSARCEAFLLDHGMRQWEIDSIRRILLG